MRLFMPVPLNPSGISMACREVYKLVKGLGFSVSTLLTVDEASDLLEKDVVESMKSDSAPVPGDVAHLHVGPPSNMSVVKRARALVGMFVMEGRRLTPCQVVPCRTADVCAVPSSFCADACLASGIPGAKVKVVPYPLDEGVWNSGIGPSMPSDGRFRFLCMNSIYDRKGLDVLLKAWWAEFGKDEPVLLVIKSYRENDRPGPAAEFIMRIADEAGVDPGERAPVAVLDEPIRDEDVPGFMKSFDAVVSSHRSEGFGLTPWHAMALGVPVVCTDYGGVRDFANEDTAWLISVDRMVPPSTSEAALFPQFEGITWAEPSLDGARNALRACASDADGRRRRAREGVSLVSSKYSFDMVGEAFLDALEEAIPGGIGALEREDESLVPDRFDGSNPVVMSEV